MSLFMYMYVCEFAMIVKVYSKERGRERKKEERYKLKVLMMLPTKS